jgi:hypothetical protein
MSSRNATLSTPFVWQDVASGTSVVAHWHPGGYGRLNPESGERVMSSCIGSAALPGVAMCLAFRGDNAGAELEQQQQRRPQQEVVAAWPKQALVSF